MAKKPSVYSKVDFKTLKNELFGTMKYLSSEKVDDSLVDDIDWKINKKGGVNPSVVSTINNKMNHNMKELRNMSQMEAMDWLRIQNIPVLMGIIKKKLKQ